MKSSHSYRKCRSRYRCSICRGQHNLLLHVQRATSQNVTKNNTTLVANSQEITNYNLNAVKYSAALLPTALVRIKDALGNFHFCKAMLDSGSQATFIEGRLATKLQLPIQKTRITVSGLATRGLVTKGILNIEIYSRESNSEFINVKALILDSMALISRPYNTRINNIENIKGIKLADPEFHSTSKIELVLGADIFFFFILRNGKHILKNCVAQNTIFGYVIAGCDESTHSNEPISLNLQLGINIEETVARFWQTEETPLHTVEDEADHPAEVHFRNTVCRARDGRFVVRLPFKEQITRLENMYYTALRRLENLQRKLSGNQILNEEYTKFIREYEALGHMKKIVPDMPNNC